MRRSGILLGVVGLLLGILTASMPAFIADTAYAEPVTEPALLISQLKVTSGSGQFVELYNNTSEPIDMSSVQLAYYNNYEVSKSTSSKLVSLGGTLPAGAYYLVNDSAARICYQTVVASASLGFSSTAGMVQVHRLQQLVPGGPITSLVSDAAAWSKSAVSSAVQLPAGGDAFLLRNWPDGIAKQGGGGSWTAVQPSPSDPCVLESFLPGQPEAQQSAFSYLPSTLPPVRYVAAPSAAGKVVVNRNLGRMAPVVNELLPNPASPQTDADDEFVELYNPNDSVFDLSGFKIAFGSTSPKRYTIPDGTVLPPKSYKAFTSGDTSISLSNTEAQVWLLDPLEQIVGSSEAYANAKDGQAWALNNGAWQWTVVSTPGEMNAISGTASAGTTKTAAAVLGIADAPGGAAQGGTNTAVTGQAQSQDDATPLHPAVLAGIGVLAVGYAVYEYRHDMGNRIHQFRRYLRHRRALRQSV